MSISAEAFKIEVEQRLERTLARLLLGRISDLRASKLFVNTAFDRELQMMHDEHVWPRFTDDRDSDRVRHRASDFIDIVPVSEKVNRVDITRLIALAWPHRTFPGIVTITVDQDELQGRKAEALASLSKYGRVLDV